MKSIHLAILFAALLATQLSADPRLSSWFTDRSGAYARIYETIEDETAQNASTTWSRGAGSQTSPTYAGIHEIARTEDWIYIRTTNLASHVMGPWYQDLDKTELAPDWPANQATIHRFPRDPQDPDTVVTKTLSEDEIIGYFVNGVAMYGVRSAVSYRQNDGTDALDGSGDGAWNRDAHATERFTFDSSYGHSSEDAYHHHANPAGLRAQLGDSVEYDATTNTYTESFNGRHSPILGWADDGLPVYGPYGYSDPDDAESPISRMRSGYELRANLYTLGAIRDSWPEWATRRYEGQTTFSNGPSVSAAFPATGYLEDYDYKGDIGQTLGVDFDLNEYNARYCVTPEFPDGIWAYFLSINEEGEPAFPYIVGHSFIGDPTGGPVTGIPSSDEAAAAVTTQFEGGPELQTEIRSVGLNQADPSTLSITWNGPEGGVYQFEQSSDLADAEAWTEFGDTHLAESDLSQAQVDAPQDDPLFYRVNRVGLSSFDNEGFDYPVEPSGPIVTLTATLSEGPENLDTLPISIRFNGFNVDLSTANPSRPSQTQLVFDYSIHGLEPGDYSVIATYADDSQQTGNYTVHSSVLLLIVDDWGIDSSPLDNTPSDEVFLPNMPNLAALADAGLRFTRAYTQPTCSPMRATMLTGRQPFQHKVGSPETANNFSSGQDEITLPEIFTTMDAPHALLNVGKWHLGGNNTGYNVRGGWPEFYGINGGGVGDFYEWNKNNNGQSVTSTTYSTTDQVNHATEFIDENIADGTPWFAWVAFNAPHTPFHDPPAELAPEGGYSARASGESNNHHLYRKALEALDTELGRLLDSIDPAQTNIILLGDNGSPGQVVQSPFGDGNAKGDLYNGGIHVPMIAKGPAVTVAAGSETDTLVHCIDVFSTILELAGIDESAVPNLSGQNVGSTSMVPIYDGTDTAERFVVAERAATGPNAGRALISGSYPDYKLIINGDPDDTTDTPTYEFFNVGAPAFDFNEQSPLNIGGLTGDALAAYNACIAKDAELGGGYSDPPQ